MFGLSESDFEGAETGTVAVWPENWEAVRLLIAVSGQWRVSMAGAYALDYVAVAAVLDMWGIKRKKRKALFDDLRVLEEEALAVMGEGKDV